MKRGSKTRLAIKVAGLLAVTAAAAGLMLQKAPAHVSVAPWDYPDAPNTHAIARPGAPIPPPKRIVHAVNGVATLPNGMTVRLVALSKGNTHDQDHWLTPGGGLVDEELSPVPNYDKDGPPRTDGRFRELLLEYKNPPATGMIPYTAYVPDGARLGLSWDEKIYHGWDPESMLNAGVQGGQLHLQVYVDDPKADRLLFGMPTEGWTKIDSGSNLVKKAPFLHKDLIKGAWGSATVTEIPSLVAAYSKSYPGGPRVVVTLEPAPAYADDDLRLRAFDGTGKEIPLYNVHQMTMIAESDLPKIDHFEVEARPYTYVEFTGVHYDPDPKQWENIVWGEKQEGVSATIGDTSVNVVAVVDTRPGTRDWNREQFVTHNVYTVGGKLWKDAPDWITQATYPSHDITTASPTPQTLPQPMALLLTLAKEGDEKPNIRIQVTPSDSATPGKGLHPEWNSWTQNWLRDPYGGLIEAPPRVFMPVAPAPQAKYLQVQMDSANGPYRKTAEVVPNVAEVKMDHAHSHDYSLEIGKTAHARFWLPDGTPTYREVSTVDLSDRQTRVYARLKSGERKLLKVTSYSRTGGDPELRAAYDFDRDPGIPLGLSNFIPLVDVAAFEIESRPVEKKTLVVPIPGRP